MRLRNSIGATAGLCATAQALQGTSPFFATLPASIPADDFAVTYATASQLKSLLNTVGCPYDVNVIISQPGVSAGDFQDQSASRYLRQRMEQIMEDESQQMVAVPKVVDLLDSDGVAQHYSTKCGASLQRVNGSMGVGKIDASKPAVVKLDFPVLPEKQRISALRHNDGIVHDLLNSFPDSYSLGVTYITSPPQSPAFHDGPSSTHPSSHKSHSSHDQHPLHVVDFDAEHVAEEPMLQAWKRDIDSHIPAHLRKRQDDDSRGNSTNAPLFEAYNFLSPGIFMGLVALILLLSILYVAMSAVASVEVSEGSFNKEMVQAMLKAQKAQ